MFKVLKQLITEYVFLKIGGQDSGGDKCCSRAHSFSGHLGLRFYRVQCIIKIVQVENILKVSPDWICAVTSRFTKLFYCESANTAHIHSGDTLVQ